jgi:3-oxoacyl-[acyl-carrier-protein] synthase-3
MIGISKITTYLPENRRSNYDLLEKFEVDKNFIDQKIGFIKTAKKADNESVVDMCLKAIDKLEKDCDLSEIEFLILVTQNPDFLIPHNSAVIHEKLELPETCMCFDISQGCAGYLHGLSIAKGVASVNKFKKGLLLTCDPYSKVVNDNDKNTRMIFGDAATATLLEEESNWEIGAFDFGTAPQTSKSLNTYQEDLFMDGRGIFNFVLKYLPPSVSKTLEKNELSLENIDEFVLHPGSKYVIDFLAKRLKVDSKKVPFEAGEYGNTVSSSIPLLLEKRIQDKIERTYFISGFGVGLSWGSTIIRRRND